MTRESKTRHVATKGDSRRIIDHRPGRWGGWLLPPEEGSNSRVGGTGAKRECIERWEAAGWTVAKETNPNHRPRSLFASFG